MVTCCLQALGNKLFLTSKKRPDEVGTGKTEAGYERFIVVLSI